MRIESLKDFQALTISEKIKVITYLNDNYLLFSINYHVPLPYKDYYGVGTVMIKKDFNQTMMTNNDLNIAKQGFLTDNGIGSLPISNVIIVGLVPLFLTPEDFFQILPNGCISLTY